MIDESSLHKNYLFIFMELRNQGSLIAKLSTR